VSIRAAPSSRSASAKKKKKKPKINSAGSKSVAPHPAHRVDGPPPSGSVKRSTRPRYSAPLPPDLGSGREQTWPPPNLALNLRPQMNGFSRMIGPRDRRLLLHVAAGSCGCFFRQRAFTYSRSSSPCDGQLPAPRRVSDVPPARRRALRQLTRPGSGWRKESPNSSGRPLPRDHFLFSPLRLTFVGQPCPWWPRRTTDPSS